MVASPPSSRGTGSGISAIVIARNAERFITEALLSIVGSTRPPDEILVIDGGSTDRTRELASRVAGVRVLAQQSTGIAAAYNEGIAAASAPLIAFLSADDRWMPEKLAMQEAVMTARPEVELVLCHVQHELEPGCAAPSGFRTALLQAPVPGHIMECVLVRRTLFDRIGGFDPAFAVSEDTDWFARARDAGVPTVVLPETLVRKRVHDRNSSLTERNINGLLLRALRGAVSRKRATQADD